MEDFLDPPVHLYIKTHRVTGLKYFGMTVKDPFVYRGSGLYWLRHLSQHGNDVNTEVFETFTSRKALSSAANKFSSDYDIVKSEAWANLIDETGKSGMAPGRRELTDEQRGVYSNRIREYWKDPAYREKVLASRKATNATDEGKKIRSEAAKKAWALKSEEGKAKVSETSRRTMLQGWSDPVSRERLLANSRKSMSEEAKAKAKPKLQGPKTEAHKEKLREKAKNRRHPRAPAEAVFVRPGCYRVGGIILTKSPAPKNTWDSKDGLHAFKTLKEAVSKLEKFKPIMGGE